MEPGVLLIIGLIVGGICAAVASSKGRSGVGWFFGGFFFGLIAIVIVAVLPNLREEERRRQHDMAERRRLREQLRQEKMKTESFRHHATNRLDTHDGALGLDTRRTSGLGAGKAQPILVPRVAPPPLPPAAAEGEGATWFYAADGETRGPVPESTLVWMLQSGALKGSSLVWRDGLAEWTAASSIPAFRAAGGAG